MAGIPLVTPGFKLKGFLADVTSVPPIVVLFKLNPNTLTDSKPNDYVSIKVPGLHYTKKHWTGGSDRTLSFELFIDGYEQGTSLVGIPLIDGGIRPDLAAIQSFLYPKNGNVNSGSIIQGAVSSLGGGGNNLFGSGGDQFVAPPQAVFCLGNLLVDVIVRKAEPKITMFNSKLDPVRATVSFQLEVLEYTALAKYQDYLRRILTVDNLASVASALFSGSSGNIFKIPKGA